MSDHFLNKLKSIRERYGIEKEKSSFIKLECKPSSETVYRKNYSVQKEIVIEKPSATLLETHKIRNSCHQNSQNIQRPQSFNKRPVKSELNINDNALQENELSYLLHKKSYDRAFREKNYSKTFKATYACDEPECQPETLARTYSQQKTEFISNKYGLIYNYDENLNTLPAKTSQFISQSLQREPLRLLNNQNISKNTENLNFNYDKLSKPSASMYCSSLENNLLGEKSYINKDKRTESSNNNWTIDKLSKVQEKIQAYLNK